MGTNGLRFIINVDIVERIHTLLYPLVVMMEIS